MNHVRFHSTAALAIAAGLIGAPAGLALADQPVVPNCVGTTFSGGADALPAGELGQLVKGFAQAPDDRPGLGDGIQALQAGLVADDVANNTCND